jgi:RNA polymerase sigma-70 factor (ECF subfamily)
MPPAPDRAAALARCLPALSRTARRLTPGRAEAEDLVQETVLRVWTRLSDGAEVRDMRPYLFATLRNLACRPGRRTEALEEDEAPPVAPVAEARLAAREVLRALAALPEEQAVLIRGLVFDGASFDDLARRHGLPVGTVTSRIARGRARLARRLDLPADAPVAALLRS